MSLHGDTEQTGEQPAQMTRWSLVARAQNANPDARMAALEQLLATYLPVLEWYLTRHSGLDAHRREDLVQGFVTDKLLRQSILDRAKKRTVLFQVFGNRALVQEQGGRSVFQGSVRSD